MKSENILVSYTRPPAATGGYEPPLITDVRLIDFDMCCRLNETSLADGPGSLGFAAPGTNELEASSRFVFLSTRASRICARMYAPAPTHLTPPPIPFAAEAMIRQVRDPTKLDVWSVACVLLEMAMGRDWFNAHWLNTYRSNRDVRHHGAEGFHAFSELLQQHAASARASVQTASVRTILQLGLVTELQQRASARGMLAAIQAQPQLQEAQAAERDERTSVPPPIESEQPHTECGSTVSDRWSPGASEASRNNYSTSIERRPRDVRMRADSPTTPGPRSDPR